MVVAVLVIAGLAVWIAYVIRRARSIESDSDLRLAGDLRGAIATVETPTTPGAPGIASPPGNAPLMFSDDLPSIDPPSAPADPFVDDLFSDDPFSADPFSADRPSNDPASPDPALANPALANPALVNPVPGIPASPGTRPTTASTEDIEARLARLGDLHARGVITDSELAEARAKILAE